MVFSIRSPTWQPAYIPAHQLGRNQDGLVYIVRKIKIFFIISTGSYGQIAGIRYNGDMKGIGMQNRVARQTDTEYQQKEPTMVNLTLTISR